MNQITGERNNKKGFLKKKRKNRQATAEGKRASATQKRKYTQSIQEEQQNKTLFHTAGTERSQGLVQK